MNDLNERLQGIDRLSPPDLWSVARAKAESGSGSAHLNRSGWQRSALIATSLAVGLGAVAWLFITERDTPSTLPVAQPVISPAPRGDCPIGLVRSSRVDTTEFVRMMNGYLPTWMPEGFGLLASFDPEAPARGGLGGYGIWTDYQCRQVELYFQSAKRLPGHRAPTTKPTVGPWTVDADVPRGCSNMVLGKARCLDYSTATPDGYLSLLMMGLDRSEGDRIALSIFGQESTSVTPTKLDYLGSDERWAPTVRVEGKLAIMPLTFPEGTIAELRYDAGLRLEDLNVTASTGVDGPSGCGFTANATRYDPTIGWIRPDTPPLFEHTRPDGLTVGLWEGQRWNAPYDYLVFPFGDWSVIIGCQTGRDGPDPELLERWMDGVDGEMSEDGLIVLDGTDPITVHPWTDIRSAPAITLQGDDLYIDVRVTEWCRSATADLSVDDEVAQWCINPDAGVYVYANASSPEAKERLRGFIETATVQVPRQAR